MATTVELLRRRFSGAYTVDEWGLDTELVELVSPLFGLRWGIDVAGAENVPLDGPAVLLLEGRPAPSAPWVVSRGVRLATGRFVRVLGLPDVAPVGPVLRRFGAALDREDELAGLLREGNVVVTSTPPVVDDGVPVLRATANGRELGRRWRVTVGLRLP